MERILIIDDSVLETHVLREILKERYELISARTGEDGLSIALTDLPELILLDIVMPGMDGFAVLQNLKASEETKNIPVMFLTGITDEKMEEKGLLMGAVDYIRKPYNPNIVKARVRSQIKSYLYTKTIESQLSVDSLTGVYNRRNFDQKIEAEWGKALEEKALLSFMMIDIDYFKKINDTYGHPEGDYVLRSIAGAINNIFEPNGDYVSRYGGEEFAVILHNREKEAAEDLAEQLRMAVYNLNIPNESAPLYKRLTVSIGGSTILPTEEDSMREFILEADRALYCAKKQGRNCFVWHDLTEEGE